MSYNPHRGYRKYLQAYCEFCGDTPHPALLDAHHITPQAEFRRKGKGVTHGLNIATCCVKCHRKIEAGFIVVKGRVASSAGKILEYYLVDHPERMLYTARGPL